MEKGSTYLVVYTDDKGFVRAKDFTFIEESDTHFVFTNARTNKEEGILISTVIRWQEIG